jgi:uncharacterized protein (DUF58 family)
MAQGPLIDRTFLERLERLTIHWSKSFPGLVGGHDRSRFSGPGQEFLDHRHFHQGDDLRSVNWRAYLRLEKLFLKMFQIEPRVPVRLMLDVSESMSTGSPSKFDCARRLAAALTYVGLVRLDSVTVQPFAAQLLDPITASGGRHRFSPTAEFLTALQPGGVTDLMAAARAFVGEYSQRGLLIVVSDFLDDGEYDKPLQLIADFGHELSLIQLWADEDRVPPWDGELDLRDAETGRRMQISFNEESRAMYTRAFDDFSDALERLALRNSGRYVGLPSSMPVEEAVFGPLIRSRGVA